MAELPEEIVALFKDPQSIKVLGTVGGNGAPHAVHKGSLTVLDDGYIAYSEGSDSSQTNKNMVRSIWFDKPVSVTVINARKAYQIKGKPYKCLINGPIFRQFLLRARERGGPAADIQSVWLIAPEEVRAETPGARRSEEAENRPYLNRHLDRDAVKGA
ncbi:MAG: pyridoxamine 5'-phosphate oxidase family protein [Chloroflexota bacterium]|nr:MAG: pyridoxamine 5'-phosphate oxidase family protein [Chloroflexota bacterium]